jgi:hypothetical protein
MNFVGDIKVISETLLQLWANALNNLQDISFAVQLFIIIAVFILVKSIIQPC